MVAREIMSASEIEASPERWHALRREGIGASETAAMLGIDPHGSPYALFVAKVTGKELKGDTDAMMRGRYLEPVAAEMFREEQPDLALTPGGLCRSEDRRWQLATFDRLAVHTESCALSPVQIKTSVTHDGWGEPGTSAIPVHYRAQVLQELDVAEADTAIIPCLFIGSWQLQTYYIYRDDNVEHDIRLIRDEGERFMNRIADNDPPPVDWTPSTTKALRVLYPAEIGSKQIPAKLAKRYRAGRKSLRTAQQRLGLVVNQILAAGEGARVIEAEIGGEMVKVATRTAAKRPSVDVKLLRRRYPDIAQECTREAVVEALYPSGWSQQDT